MGDIPRPCNHGSDTVDLVRSPDNGWRSFLLLGGKSRSKWWDLVQYYWYKCHQNVHQNVHQTPKTIKNPRHLQVFCIFTSCSLRPQHAMTKPQRRKTPSWPAMRMIPQNSHHQKTSSSIIQILKGEWIFPRSGEYFLQGVWRSHYWTIPFSVETWLHRGASWCHRKIKRSNHRCFPYFCGSAAAWRAIAHEDAALHGTDEDPTWRGRSGTPAWSEGERRAASSSGLIYEHIKYHDRIYIYI